MALLSTSSWHYTDTRKGRAEVVTNIYDCKQDSIPIEGARGFVFVGELVVLVHAHVKNGWQIPGGGKEGDEKPEQTFRRELQEETGIVELQTLHTLCYRVHHRRWENDTINTSQDCIFVCESSSLPAFTGDVAGGVDATRLVEYDALNVYLRWDETSFDNLISLVDEYRESSKYKK